MGGLFISKTYLEEDDSCKYMIFLKKITLHGKYLKGLGLSMHRFFDNTISAYITQKMKITFVV